MSRHDDTAEVAGSGDQVEVPSTAEPVGRVNLPDEPDVDFDVDDTVVHDAQQFGVTTLPTGNLREKILYGLLAAIMMVLAMVVILQGVFEQKMPI